MKKTSRATLTRLVAYWIAFGPHGPRALPPPGEGKKIFIYTMLGIGASGVLFGVSKHFAGPPPSTMTKEYQEESERYLKVSTIRRFREARLAEHTQ